MGYLGKEGKEAIRRGAWSNDADLPEHLQKHYRIRIRNVQGFYEGPWINRHGFLNKCDAEACWNGLEVPSGFEARLLYRDKEIARKDGLAINESQSEKPRARN